MEVRRFRRQARNRRQTQTQTILPLRFTSLTNTISCWYCDYKISRFNEPIFEFGQKYARYLRVWFDVGVGFSLSVLFGVTMILIWEVVATLCLSDGSNKVNNYLTSLMFGIHPSGLGFNMAMTDVLYLVVSTVISVIVHEFGHAAAAASTTVGTTSTGSSEGIQLEYIAIFLAVLFPGALIALNYEILQAKPRFASLRIYCAGIWHNAALCAACGLALLLLPYILSPFFQHGEGPMVLGISGSSPVSAYLSPGDVIVSLEGIEIHNAQDWLEAASSLEKMLANSDPKLMKGSLKRKTYCVPSSLVQKSEKVSLLSNYSSCPDEHFAFVSVPCSVSNFSSDKDAHAMSRMDDDWYCLNSADIDKISSCESLLTPNDHHCTCSENEQCLSPVQMPGILWVEIVYKNSYSHQCMKFLKNSTALESFDVGDECHKTFLYVGDVISMAHSVRLTSFLPRFTSLVGASLPNMLEKLFACIFNISVALALLNSLPVYCLDGESILEASSFYATVLNPGSRKKLLQVILIGGSIMSCFVILRTFLLKF